MNNNSEDNEAFYLDERMISLVLIEKCKKLDRLQRMVKITDAVSNYCHELEIPQKPYGIALDTDFALSEMESKIEIIESLFEDEFISKKEKLDGLLDILNIKLGEENE